MPWRCLVSYMASLVSAEETIVSQAILNGYGEDVARARRSVLYKDRRTKLILKTVFSELCPACEKYLKQLEREVARLKETNPLDANLVRKVSDLIVQFIRETDQLAVNIDSFTEQKWNLHGGNMHSEFSKVAQETFKGDTNWGRILMFFGFAVSFSVYLEQGIVPGAADSVMEWTCQLVEEELGKFYTAHQGWVSGVAWKHGRANTVGRRQFPLGLLCCLQALVGLNVGLLRKCIATQLGKNWCHGTHHSVQFLACSYRRYLSMVDYEGLEWRVCLHCLPAVCTPPPLFLLNRRWGWQGAWGDMVQCCKRLGEMGSIALTG